MPELDTLVDSVDEYLRRTGTNTYTGDTATQIFEKAAQTINAQTGTTYTLVLTDTNRIVTLTNGSAITLTVPPNASVAIPIGTTVRIIQGGAGQVTVAQGVGVTVNVAGTFTKKLLEQNAEATLTKLATNTWLLTGVLEAA